MSAKDSNASKFERKAGDNLIYRHKLTLNDALQCRSVKLTTLDNRTLLIAIDQIPSPGSVKVIHGEGMVCHNDTAVGSASSEASRGDLYILFDVVFPKKLAGPECRQQLVEALSPAVAN